MAGSRSISWATCGFVVLLAACTSQPCVMPEAPKVKALPTTTMDEPAEAEQRTVLGFGGQHCEFYLHEVEGALRKVPGVKTLDFRAIKDHVVVTYELGRTNPMNLLNAINSVRGDGYYCKAKIIPG